MRYSPPLPPLLINRAMTPSQLVQHGFDRRRVYRQDMVGLGSGTFIARDTARSLTPAELLGLKALALAAESPTAWLSHLTAARLMRFPLPRSTHLDRAVHLSFPVAPGSRWQRAGVVSHRSRLPLQQLVISQGVRCSPPSRVWVELAESLTVEDLVVLGDHLVRRPYPWAEQRQDPLSSMDDLRQEVSETGRVPGKTTAVKALGLIREGADSPKETQFRLALLRAGLPEPELQVPAQEDVPGSPRADAAWRRWKVAIQYDGATHFTPEQARLDQRRDNRFVSYGWMVLRFNLIDDRDGFVTAVRQTESALRMRGWQGT